MAEQKTTEQIDAELSAARDVRAGLNLQLSDVLKNLETLKVSHEQAVLARDSKKDKLYHARKKAEQDIEEFQMLLKQADADVARLEQEHAEAARAEIEAEIEDEESGLLADCLMLDSAIAAFVSVRDAIYLRRDRLIALNTQLNRDFTRYQKIATHLRRSVDTQLFGKDGDGSWMRKGDRDLYGMPFSKFLETVVLHPEEQPVESDKVIKLADAREAS